MIARLRAWLAAPKLAEELDFQLESAAQRNAVIDRLIADNLRATGRITELEEQVAGVEKRLSKEQLTTAALESEVAHLVRQNNVINLRADAAIAEAARVRADAEYVAAERCECGGDAELHWRRRAAAAEERARQDRANAVRLADEVERLRLRADEADRLVHIVEQLERAR